MAKPVRPEPKFFLHEELCARGVEFYENTYFASSSLETRLWGEKSTSYIEREDAAQRIQKMYPNSRIVMILRDPVDRAWSNYRFSVKHGIERLGFEAALAAESERLSDAVFTTSVNPYAYRRRGHYIEYIRNYLRIFRSDQVSILIFEETVGNLPAIQALYRSLGVEDSFVPPSFNDVINSGDKDYDVPLEAFRGLALGYRQSLEALENHLGRPVNAWRRRWDSFGEGRS